MKSYGINEDPSTINEAIIAYRRALQLDTIESPIRANRLGNLGNALTEQYKISHEDAYLDEAIKCLEEGKKNGTGWFIYRLHCLNNLGNALRERYEKNKSLKDFEGAVEIHNELLAFV